MKRSSFIQLSILGGLAVACGASKKEQKNGLPVQKAAGTGDPFTWKPGDPININPVEKTEEEWKEILTAEQYHILREDGTETAFDNAFWDNKEEGIYYCAACALPLYSSKTKYKSGTGWPSFWEPIDPKVIKEVEDRSFGMVRTETECAQCRSHIGHVFKDGPEPTGLRYCMNSLAMGFRKIKL